MRRPLSVIVFIFFTIHLACEAISCIKELQVDRSVMFTVENRSTHNTRPYLYAISNYCYVE